MLECERHSTDIANEHTYTAIGVDDVWQHVARVFENNATYGGPSRVREDKVCRRVEVGLGAVEGVSAGSVFESIGFKS